MIQTQTALTPQQLRSYDQEGYIVLENLLSETDMAPPKAAMSEKVDEITADLLKAGLIADLLEDEPFPTRNEGITSSQWNSLHFLWIRYGALIRRSSSSEGFV